MTFESDPAAEAGGSIEEAVLSALSSREVATRGEVIDDAARMVDPEDLIDAVADQDNAIRRNAAIEALVRAGPRSLPTVVRALRHRDPEVVMFAAGILGRTRDALAVPHLIKLLSHPDINVAQGAIDSLAQLRAGLAVDALVAMLDKDPWLRFAAVHALGAIGEPRAVEALVPLLDDESLFEAVTDALGKIGSPDALTHLAERLRQRADDDGFNTCLKAIGEALQQQPNEEGLRTIPPFAALASGEVEGIHERLTQVLAASDEASLSTDDLALKEAAAEVVCALRIRSLYGALVKAGREPLLRDLIQFCAVSIGDDITPALALGLKVADASVRQLACNCIGALNLRDLAPQVEKLLADADDDVRTAAIVALARLKHDAAIPSFVHLLASPSARVQSAVASALGQMDPEVVSEAILSSARVLAAAHLTVLEVMCANPHPLQRPFIEKSLAHDDPEVRRAAVAALTQQPACEFTDVLAPLLDDSDIAVRREVVIVLGQSRSRKARQLLIDQIAKDAETRTYAVRSLGDLGDATVVPLLMEMFEREPPMGRLAIIETLAELKEPAAEPLLVHLLGDADPEVRRTAVQALGRFATSAAIRHAVAAARDPEWQVRAAVVEVLAPQRDPNAAAALERLCLDPNPLVASLARRRIEEPRMV